MVFQFIGFRRFRFGFNAVSHQLVAMILSGSFTATFQFIRPLQLRMLNSLPILRDEVALNGGICLLFVGGGDVHFARMKPVSDKGFENLHIYIQFKNVLREVKIV